MNISQEKFNGRIKEEKFSQVMMMEQLLYIMHPIYKRNVNKIINDFIQMF